MGGGGDDETTILETPPYVIALVLFFFLVVSLGFEKIMHYVKSALQRRGKQGLVSAMNNMQSELMCLGVATLILLVFESNITTYCTMISNTTIAARGFLVHHNHPAKSCVSELELSRCCSPEETGVKKDVRFVQPVCTGIFDDDPDWNVPDTQGLYSVNTVTGAISVNSSDHRRRLHSLNTMRALLGSSSGSEAALIAAEEVQCDGRVQTGAEECGYKPNVRPAIGPNALHQIHIFIFITAIIHIALGISLILISSLRLRIWRRGRKPDDDVARMIQQAVDEHSRACDAVATAGSVESQGGLPSISEKPEAEAGSAHPMQLPTTFAIERAKHWSGRPEDLHGLKQYAREILICLGRQVVPNVVTQEEFSIMRSAFMLTHHIRSNGNFHFLDYLRDAMEDDFAHVVGLGLPMWCFIIVFVLLSSAIGWCIWVFVIISGALLAILNTKLIWIARYVTRGGHVHRLKPGIFWLNRPWLFLPVIKFLLFFVSYVYANAVFFAAEFGSTSCFFSSVGFQGQPVPWWVIMMVNTIFLLSLSLLTLPLFSITVQMGGDFKAQLLPKDIVDNALRVHSLQVSGSTGLRRLISNFLPKERDALCQVVDHSGSLLHIAGSPASKKSSK